jgi:polyprenyl P-hydroxybenzoate/phenylacrylic acid decarboxylase-like protein
VAPRPEQEDPAASVGNPNSGPATRIVVGITGATGAIFGVRMLEILASAGVETHLCMSQWGQRTLEHETDLTVADVRALARFTHSANDQSAVISSGSFVTSGMVIAPCSMRTLAAISYGLADNLITRAAEVTLKERRRLVLMVRETPLTEVHLENMLRVARAGAVVMPPVPAFYSRPPTIADVVDHLVVRAIDLFGLHLDVIPRWSGSLWSPARGVGKT